MIQLGQRTGVLVALGIALLPLAVFAQAATAFAQENGVKIGEGRLHPYFDLEFRYDSLAAGRTADGVLHFRPGLRLDLPPGLVELSFNGNVDYLLFTGMLDPAARRLSHLEAMVALDAAINREGAVELDIGDRLSRSDRTTDIALGAGVLSLYNELRAALPIHPGGGALEVTPSAAWGLELFQPYVPGDQSYANRNYHNYRFGLDGRWKFLPKTAVGIETSLDTRKYDDPSNLPPLLFKARVGLTGLVSTRVAVVAKAGWSQDFATSGARTVVGQLELNYLLNEGSSLKFGYLRDLSPVAEYGVFGDDRGYADARFLLGGRLFLHGSAAYDYITFYERSTRRDQALSLDVGPEFKFTSWLSAALGYTLGLRRSNDTTPGRILNYTRHEAYVRLSLSY